MPKLMTATSFLAIAFFTANAALLAIPSAPTALNAGVTGNTVTLSWSAPGGFVTGYRLEAGTAPGLSNAANVLLGTLTSFSTSGVPAGVYFVRVKAVALDGESSPSNEVVVTVGHDTGCHSVPTPPALSANVAGTVVTLQWTSTGSCPASNYILYAGSTPGATNIAVQNLGSALQFSATVPNGTYHVFVVAQNASGLSGPSNVVPVLVGSITPPPSPVPPPPLGHSFGPGQWFVNSQISPGRYFADPASGCYWERQRGLSGSLNDVVANEFVGFDALQWIVDIAGSDFAFETDGDCGRWYSTPRHGAQINIPAGIWLVGAQLAPGTYRVGAGPGCYWERLRGFSGNLNDIIDNEFVSYGGQQLVTILPTDVGFSNDNDCGTWTRIADVRDSRPASGPDTIELNWWADHAQRTGGEPRALVKQD